MREHLDKFLDLENEVRRLTALRAKWQGAATKRAQITVQALLTIDGQPVTGEEQNAVTRAIQARANRGIAAALADAITDVTAQRDAARAAAKTEYDALFP